MHREMNHKAEEAVESPSGSESAAPSRFLAIQSIKLGRALHYFQLRDKWLCVEGIERIHAITPWYRCDERCLNHRNN